MSAYRPEFEAALRLFARASEAMHARGLQRPVLVGGAAAELYPDLDRDYLERRIREESMGDYGIADIED